LPGVAQDRFVERERLVAAVRWRAGRAAIVHKLVARSQPHNGAVRILFRVNSPLVSTIPSPVPMSCNRKSLKGWIILLPSAAGTVNVPPLITDPDAAVVIERTWQTEQSRSSNRSEPGSVASFKTIALLRGGALVERMKRVNASTSLGATHSTKSGNYFVGKLRGCVIYSDHILASIELFTSTIVITHTLKRVVVETIGSSYVRVINAPAV